MVALTHAAPPAAVPEAVGAWLDSLADVYSDADRRRFSAAYAMVPVLIMIVYLLAIRRTGALEEL